MGRILRFDRGDLRRSDLTSNRPFSLTLTLRQPVIRPPAASPLTPELLAQSEQLLDETIADMARKDDEA